MDGKWDDEVLRSSNMSAKIAELQVQLNSIENELTSANQLKAQLEQEVDALKQNNAELMTNSQEQQLEDEQYQAKITELSSMFAKITPSKAAPIIQSMTLEEVVLIFSNMRPEDRVRIMEKMNPTVRCRRSFDA